MRAWMLLVALTFGGCMATDNADFRTNDSLGGTTDIQTVPAGTLDAPPGNPAAK